VRTDRFQIVGESLTGRGLSFVVNWVSKENRAGLAEMVEVVYRQGRDSARLPYDDRFDLDCTVEALRALAVIVGPSATGDRYRRSADIIARLLQDQRDGGVG
jgi:hypothetical protein